MCRTEEHDKLMCREVLAVDPCEAVVTVLLNMLSRVERDACLAPAFTRMCRHRCHLPVRSPVDGKKQQLWLFNAQPLEKSFTTFF